MKQSSAVVRFLTDWFLILIGVTGSILCLITAFSLPIPEGLWSVILVTVTANCLALGHRGWDRYTALILLGGLGLLFWLIHEELIESFQALWYRLSICYAQGYDWILDFIPEKPDPDTSISYALMYIPMVQAYLCALSLRVWKRTVPCAAALLLGVLPCFVLLDTPPMLLALLAVVFSVLAQALSQSVRRREPGEHGKAVALAAVLSAALLGALIWFIPQKTYTPPLSWTDLTQKMERWGAQQNNRGNLIAGLSGNPEEVDLTSLGALPNHPSTVLYVRSTRDGYLYLRGSSYTDFNGERWARGTGRSWAKSAVYPYVGRAGSWYLTVETVNAEAQFYTAYQLTELPENAELASDAYLRNAGGVKKYDMRYIPAPNPVDPDPSYDVWVRETCLWLPEETKAGVLDWWEAHGLGYTLEEVLNSGQVAYYFDGPLDFTFGASQYSETNYVEYFAQKAADLVSGCAAYSRSPDRVPEGEDFCTWFLNDAKNGYCVHYATACTALLRAMGIPARYVSGYVCDAERDRTMTVTNLQAHAWVEIWNGGRWVVVEPTPGNATEFTGNAYIPGSLGETETTEPFVPESVSKPFEETMPPMTYEHTNPTQPSRETTEPTEPGGGKNPVRPLNMTPLWIFLGVIGFLALVLGRRALALRLWEKRLARAGTNDKARLFWRRICRLHRHGGGEIPQLAKDLAEKASFSQYTLEEEELRFLRQLCDQQTSRAALNGFWRKLYCKYILAII